MSIEIKNLDGVVIHTVDADSLVGADLRDSNLIGAYLRGAIINPSQVTDLVKALGVIVKEEV